MCLPTLHTMLTFQHACITIVTTYDDTNITRQMSKSKTR